MLLAVELLLTCACGDEAVCRGATVLFASGADLQSINPLLTLHPLARQVQRYVLLTTLARYDSLLVPRPYLARGWRWSDGGRALTFRLRTDVRWHDGTATTARDVVWTLQAARDPATGYPRFTELQTLTSVAALDDSTIELRFSGAAVPRAGADLPDVLTDLAILPAHLLDSVPHARLRDASWNVHPVGNGPFRFVTHEPNRRWVFARSADFPPDLGGPPHVDRQERGDGSLCGCGTVAEGPVPSGVPRCVAQTHAPLAPDSARRVVAALGATPRFELLTVGSGEAALEQMLQARLNAVGFDVTIRQLENATFQDRLTGERHDFAAAVTGIPGDPELGYLQSLGRLTGIAVPTDPIAAQRLFAEQLPVVWLYHARGVQAMNSRVQGVRMDMRGELPTVAAWRVQP